MKFKLNNLKLSPFDYFLIFLALCALIGFVLWVGIMFLGIIFDPNPAGRELLLMLSPLCLIWLAGFFLLAVVKHFQDKAKRDE